MILKMITVIWAILITILSHVSGRTSADESQWLSQITGLNEGMLRLNAHIVCFGVFAALVMISYPKVNLRIRILGLIIWAVLDEASKALPCFSGRHCSIMEIGLNILGVIIGLGSGLLCKALFT